MKDITLYHGSRGGIKGDIQPTSRELCDFGKGFYMGTDPEQAKSLVADKREPVLYKLKFRLSEIPESRILVLEDKDWLNAVLAKRKLCEEFNNLKLAEKWNKELEKYDVVIGKIADDKMLDAMERFSTYGMTDVALLTCLQSINYGLQYVAKSELACSKIDVIKETKLHGLELQQAQIRGREIRRASIDAVDEAIKATRGQGLYLDEIVKQETKRERNKGEWKE